MKKTLRPLPHLLLISTLAIGLAACEEPRTVEPGASPASSALTLSPDDKHLIIAAEDLGQVLVIERESREVKKRIDVGARPGHVIMVDDATAAVTSRGDHTLNLVDIRSGERTHSVVVGSEPLGLTKLKDKNQVVVALSGESALAVVDLKTLEVKKRVELMGDDPRAVAQVKDGRLFVAHMKAGILSEVHLGNDTVRALPAETRNDFGPEIHPQHIRTLTVAPDGDSVHTAHSQANATVVRAPIGGTDTDGDGFEDEFIDDGSGGCGYGGCFSELGAVNPSVTEIDVGSGEVVVPTRDAPGGGGGDVMPMDCFDCEPGAKMMSIGTAPPNVLNHMDDRFGFGQIPMHNPTTMALVDGGRGQLVVNMGTQNVVLLSRKLSGFAGDVQGSAKIGHGAHSIALSSDGTLAYVYNQFDGTVTEIEIPMVDVPSSGGGGFLDALGSDEPESNAFNFDPEELVTATFAVHTDPLPADVSLGRKLFHTATDERITTSASVSCAGCHPDGRADGNTWLFTFGPRNPPQLGGNVVETAPLHWPGDVVDVADLNRATVQAFMGGSGMHADDMGVIASFLATIPPAPAPSAARDSLSDAELRGKALFEDPVVGCNSCHAGPHGTDNNNYDVGTRSQMVSSSSLTMNDRSDFQVPVLHGLARSAPYLHDGSARTLEDVVHMLVKTDMMGTGSHLSDAELDDLVAYLKTL
jgi:DNA-binding beta-propeller fold protein YncE